jgi:hypothetical protein
MQEHHPGQAQLPVFRSNLADPLVEKKAHRDCHKAVKLVCATIPTAAAAA